MEVEIQCAEELRLLIAGILLFKPINLIGAEARYLRKHMGCTADELAKIMGVTRITVARWEGRKNNIPKTHDKHLRRVYLDKNKSNLRKLPDITRFIKTLPDYFPQQNKPEYKIDSEAWIDSAAA